MRLVDGQIDVWDRVKAEEAGLYDLQGKIGVSLHRIDGSSLYRGREYRKERFDWVGFAYALKPDAERLHYAIEIHRG